MSTKITVAITETNYPDNWISAAEANEIATSVTNTALSTFLNNAMGYIKEAAKNGKTKTSFCCVSANNEVYERGSAILRELGYRTSTAYPTQGSYLRVDWA